MPTTPGSPRSWDARRDALGIDYGPDTNQIRPPEIKTVERLLARGDRLVHIRRDTTAWRPTSDYLWTPVGTVQSIRIEIKSLEERTMVHEATFPMRIKKSVGKSKAHGAESRKRAFLLDAADRDVPEHVLHRLRSYNRDNPDHRIDHLWLMSRGRVTEIELA